MYSDIAALYSFALPVFIAAGLAFLSGVAFGIWVVVRFCEVKQGDHNGSFT